MRPQGRHELDSLYFHYRHFEAPDPAEVASDRNEPVLIVGAGPVGMTAALALARHGVRSVLIDDKATFNDGSRAICISRSSMYALERMGAVAPFLEKALGWTTGRGYCRGREIGHFNMPHSPHDKYLPMYNLQQQYIEAFLHDAVVRSGMVDLRWQTQMVALAQHEDEVRVQVASPKDGYEIRTRYYLAADGARSPTRRLLGLRLKGRNLAGRYVIADMQMRHDFPTERRALFEPRSNPGGTVLVHRQPDNIWRIDYQLAPGEDEAEAIGEPNIRARVGAILEEIGHKGPWELEWWSIYSANTLCLDDYRQGQMFFIGDSAHIVPIFGVRGLNNGLLDAENIGWKLARVLTGRAPEALLDSYSPERRGATLDVFATASQSAAFMTPPTAGHELMRRAALSLSLSEDFVRPLSNPRNMTPYPRSVQRSQRRLEAGVGDELGDARLVRQLEQDCDEARHRLGLETGGGEAGKPRHHVGVDGAGTEGGGAHAVLPTREAHRMGHGDEGVLRHHVAERGREVPVALAVRGGDVDDAAPPARLEMGHRRADQAERRLDVDAPERVEVGLAPLLEGDAAEDSGVVDERVDPPEVGGRRRHPGLGGLRLVRIEARGVGAGRRPPGLAQAGRDGPAFGREPLGDGSSEAAARAGDERDPHQNSPWWTPPSFTMFCPVMKPAWAEQR
ncbi:hypothetical protein BH23PSE1_BH23PSE1_09060 [soil metagenome]